MKPSSRTTKILAAIAVTAPWYGAASAQDAAEAGNFWSFLGHYHPVVLHFPIGLIVSLVVYEIAAWPLGDARRGDLGRWVMLGLGSVSAVVAAVFGILLSWTATYDADLLWDHQWTGIAVAVAISLALLFRVWFNISAKKAGLWGYRLMLLASVGFLIPAGHHGGELTHGRGYLATDLPASLSFLRPLLADEAVAAPLSETVGSDYFARDVLPILEQKCFECHGAEKQKGELRLDTREGILSGGETGNPSVVPEVPSASYMMELILLPPESEDVMPPAGKTPLTPEEIVTLAQWIARGAPWGDYEPPPAPEPQETVEIDITLTDDSGAAPVVKTYEIMELLFEEPPERIAEALREEPTNNRERRQVMQTVFNNANLLAEAHNLLYSRNDEEYMATPEWAALAAEGRAASVELAEYLKSRDWEFDQLRARYVALIDSCNKCHVHFETGTDEVLPWPKLEINAEAASTGGTAEMEMQSED